MKLLVVAPDVPYPIRGGGRMRTNSLVQAAVSIGETHVCCVTLHKATSAIRWAENLGATLSVLPPAHLTKKQDVWKKKASQIFNGHNLLFDLNLWVPLDYRRRSIRPDIIIMETPYLLRYALPWQADASVLVDYWGTSEGAMRAYVMSRGIKKIVKYVNWKLAKAGEEKFAPLVKDIICVSKQDADYFKRIAPNSRVWPIPIGIGSDIMHPQRKVAEASRAIIFTGDMSYLPNVDACIYFVEKIFPTIRRRVHQATFHIVGRSPVRRVTDLADVKGVIVHGFVPDLREVIVNADLYVLPMRLGSGIRSKLFEVFPLEVPIVTTTIGAEGLELIDNENCRMADAPDAFAEACASLLENDGERKRIGSAARCMAALNYGQDRINRLLRTAMEAALEDGRRHKER